MSEVFNAKDLEAFKARGDANREAAKPIVYIVHPSWKHEPGEIGDWVRKGLAAGRLLESKPLCQDNRDNFSKLFENEHKLFGPNDGELKPEHIEAMKTV